MNLLRIKPSILLAMMIFLSFSLIANDEFDLTPAEEDLVNNVIERYGSQENAEQDDEDVLITVEMAVEFPRSALVKMIGCNKKALKDHDEADEDQSDFLDEEEKVRLEKELTILEEALARTA